MIVLTIPNHRLDERQLEKATPDKLLYKDDNLSQFKEVEPGELSQSQITGIVAPERLNQVNLKRIATSSLMKLDLEPPGTPIGLIGPN